jgi:hypothetical protein
MSATSSIGPYAHDSFLSMGARGDEAALDRGAVVTGV